MIRQNVIAVLVIGLLALTGCQANAPKDTAGTILGAAAGGLLGSQVGSGRGQLLGVAIGTLAGAAMGAGIGRSLDNADMAMARWNEGIAGSPTLSNRAGTRQAGQEQAGSSMIGKRENVGGDCATAEKTAALAHDETAWSSCDQGQGYWPVVD